MNKEQLKNIHDNDRLAIRKEIIEQACGTEPPIPDAPYIKVIFCKGHDRWMPFTGYGCDLDTQTTVEFINCINDATDVLNGKEGKK